MVQAKLLSASRTLAFAALSLGLLCSTVAHAQLPLQVQADLIQVQIEKDIAAAHIPAALANIDRYRGLGVQVPPKIFFVEARVASLSGDPLRAEAALTEYLRVSTREDQNYVEALRLYDDVRKAAAEERASGRSAKPPRPPTRAVAIAGGQLNGTWKVRMTGGPRKYRGTLNVPEGGMSAVLTVGYSNFPWPSEELEQKCDLLAPNDTRVSITCRSVKQTKGLPPIFYTPDTIDITKISDGLWKGSAADGRVVEIER